MKETKRWLLLGLGCVLTSLIISCESSSTPSTSITLAPASVYLTAGKVNIVTLTASGGDSNAYAWAVSNTNLGNVVTVGGTALYQSTTNAGVNTVVVTDDQNNSGSSVITQQ